MNSFEPAKILVVDDLPSQRLATEVALAELGEEVICVDSGTAALRLLLEQDFAVVLLDVNMPQIDGFETASLIRKRPRSRNTPIIFLTADSDELRIAQAYSLGAVDYLVCPFAPAVLQAKVRVFVELSKAQEQLRRETEQRVALSREQAARAAAEEESRRLRVLADVSGRLAHSLDAPALLRDLLELLVPRMADLGAVVSCQRVNAPILWRAADPHGRTTAEPSPPERAALEPLIRSALASGREVTSPEFAVFPLSAHGRPLGVYALANKRPDRRFSVADLDLLHLVASRVTAALENCRLYREIQQRDRQKDEFLAMISHELRNPLGAITAASAVLDLIEEPDTRAARAHSVIRRQSAHLTRMVDDLLDMARLVSGRFALVKQPLRLDELAERSLNALREAGRTQHHRVSFRATPVMVDADATRLEQVVANLVVNALKYTDRGGEIDVEVACEGEEALVRVRDNGVGISPDLLPRLFDLFAQADQTIDRSQGGLGIGLTLVRRLVELHGGSVEADSAGLGCGSVFTVRLPRLACEIVGDKLAPIAARPGALRILVVEDNPDVGAMIRALLEQFGHEVDSAHDGVSGLQQALASRPDLALVDVGLPGVDGLQVAEGIRAAPGGDRMILVALTGYGQESDRRRTLAAGFDLHLVKPLDPARLRDLLAAASDALADPSSDPRQTLRARLRV